MLHLFRCHMLLDVTTDSLITFASYQLLHPIKCYTLLNVASYQIWSLIKCCFLPTVAGDGRLEGEDTRDRNPAQHPHSMAI